MKWLANVPLDEDEQHGRPGPNCNKRLLPRKTLNDLWFLMEWMVTVVKNKNKYVESSVATVADMDAMFNEIAKEFQGIQDAQKKWNMVVHKL